MFLVRASVSQDTPEISPCAIAMAWDWFDQYNMVKIMPLQYWPYPLRKPVGFHFAILRMLNLRLNLDCLEVIFLWAGLSWHVERPHVEKGQPRYQWRDCFGHFSTMKCQVGKICGLKHIDPIELPEPSIAKISPGTQLPSQLWVSWAN